MKWFFEQWKKYRAVALIAAVLTGGGGLVYVKAIDGLDAIHDAARAELGKSPVDAPEQEKGGQ